MANTAYCSEMPCGRPAKKEPEKASRPPRIQSILKRAYDLKARLDSVSGLSQASLARELGLSRVRATQILNLLRIAPEIQEYILALPPSNTRGLITEYSLRRLVKNQNHSAQIKEFERLSAAQLFPNILHKNFFPGLFKQ